MPHFPHTPEALLDRSDSRNPSTTCKGITSSGRACRRALASPKSSPTSGRKASITGLGGVVRIVQEEGAIQEADFYCWQHKFQAEQRIKQEQEQKAPKQSQRPSTELFPLHEKSSIDTLVHRLGIRAVPDAAAKPKRKPVGDFAPASPRKTETQDFGPQRRSDAPYAAKYDFTQPARQRSKQKKQGFWTRLCCASEADDDYVEIVRHRRRSEQGRLPKLVSVQSSKPSQRPYSHPPKQPVVADRPPRTACTAQGLATDLSIRPTVQHHDSSQTTQLLTLIPPHLSPQITSALLAELIRPISPYDEEGYIYIFWLTPQANRAPPEETARSLLTPTRPQHERRISEVMTEFSFDGSESDRSRGKTVMLKIGRASNVTRRMNEWQRQCGYALNLVRWYPYIPSSNTPSPAPSPVWMANRQPAQPSLYPDLSRPAASRRGSEVRPNSGVVRKVPCVKRVERLIHLELAEKQVKRQCAACRKEHREWFEAEASQAGIKGVDECVRRWVAWADRQCPGR